MRSLRVLFRLNSLLLLTLGGLLAADSPEYVPGRLLAGFRQDADAGIASRALALRGATVRRQLPGLISVLDVPEKDSAAIMESLRASGLFSFVERDYYARTAAVPNDPSFASQWHLAAIQAPQAWDLSTGSSGIISAVIDSGVDATHPDLASKIRTDIDYDYVNNDSTAQDDNGHGTHVAGISAAITNNSTGIAGMCPNCSILPVKVLDASGSGTYSAIASGIRYAADKGAKVINMSLGGSAGSTTLSDAVNYANGKGVLLACAAGNSNTSAASYPAYYSACVAVAATDSSDNRASFSNYGSWVDTSAPGVSIYATYWNNTYSTLSGTSMATPHVAGLAGLLFSQGRSQSDVRTRLTSSTYTDPVNSTLIPRRINANKAVH
jgi:thermitase